MNFGSTAYKGGDRVIVRRRIEENKLSELRTAVNENSHLNNIAKWEESSAKLMKHKNWERQRAESVKLQKLELEMRQSQLRKLLICDEMKYKLEIDATKETNVQIRDRIERKAKELRQTRIKRREQFVAEQRLKQFRNKCDELRLNHGRNLTMECHRIRNKQSKENALRKEFEKTQNRKYLQIWERELQKKVERETKEKSEKKKLNFETAKAIKQQIKDKVCEEMRQKSARQKEISDRVAQCNANQEMVRLKSESELRKKEQKRAEMHREYSEYQTRQLRKKEFEKKCDKEFIDSVLQKESTENNLKKLKNKGDSVEIQKYLSYLKELKAKEVSKEQILESLRRKELEKEWDKRESKWAKEAKARQCLLQSVIDGRQSQIAHKQSMADKSQRNNSFVTQKLVKDFRDFEDKENVKRANKLKYSKEIQQFLQKQINEKRAKEIEANKLEFDPAFEANNAKYAQLLKEETEKDKIALQNGKSTHSYPKTTANWWTF